MKVSVFKSAFILLTIFNCFTGISGQGITATEIVRKADEKWNGEKSSYTVMSMTIVRPTWQRTLELLSWSLGNDYSLAFITAPAKEKGQSFLKRKSEMWSWNPSISRIIKLPPSMMSQGWMGSDYTNDDILRESSVVNDYTHTLEGEENIGDRLCYKIRLQAKDGAGVIWGHQLWWVDKQDFIALKAELYDEDDYLVRTETASDIKTMDGRVLPALLEIVPADEPGKKTIVKIVDIKFNITVPESFFSQQNMKSSKPPQP